MAKSSSEIIMIGAGHNGLVCAYYLAKKGHRVRMLERRHIIGGAAVTEEFYPGFRNSTASYTVSLLQQKVIDDMQLYRHGLKIIFRPLDNFVPLPSGTYLKFGGTIADMQAEVAKFSKADAAALPSFFDKMEAIAKIFRDLMLKTPPNAGGGISDMMRALSDGNAVRKLGLEGQRDLMDFMFSSAGDYLDRYFESDPIKAMIGFDSVVGNFASPYSPGSAYVLLHHVIGEVHGQKGTWGHALGGMGAITGAMAKACEELGVTIETEALVAEVTTANGKATGVLLEDGREIAARAVVSGLNPHLLYTKLMNGDALNEADPNFLTRIKFWKSGSGTFRMNVALSELPDFTCLPGTEQAEHHGAGIIIAPSLSYMDRAYDDAKADGWSKHPVVEMLIPSTIDDSLAPKDKHVASLFCQQFAPTLQDGRSWDDIKESAAETIIDCVNQYAPNFKNSILGYSALTPLDLERIFGLTGGDIFHGSLSPDQLYAARPMLGYANYRSPIKGLYMCGSGTHPGGGVSGAPGHNAAREILKDL